MNCGGKLQFKLSATGLAQSGVDQSTVGKRMPVGDCAMGMRVESCAAGCSVGRRLTALGPSRDPDAVVESLAAELGSSSIVLHHFP